MGFRRTLLSKPAAASRGLVDYNKIVRTSGNVTVADVGFTSVDTGIDLLIPGVVGDVIEVGLCGSWFGAGTGEGHLDAALVHVNTGTVLRYLTSGTITPRDGNPAWASYVNTEYGPIGGTTPPYTLVNSDLLDGVASVRLMGKSTGSRTLASNTTVPLVFFVKNLGKIAPVGAGIL